MAPSATPIVSSDGMLGSSVASSANSLVHIHLAGSGTSLAKFSLTDKTGFQLLHLPPFSIKMAVGNIIKL